MHAPNPIVGYAIGDRVRMTREGFMNRSPASDGPTAGVVVEFVTSHGHAEPRPLVRIRGIGRRGLHTGNYKLTSWRLADAGSVRGAGEGMEATR